MKFSLRLLFILMAGGWLSAGYLRIIHWSTRLGLDPEWRRLPLLGKSVLVSFIYLAGASILIWLLQPDTPFGKGGFIRRRENPVPRAALFLAGVLVALAATTIWAIPQYPGCRGVKERLRDSGVATEASEGWFGQIKIKEPPLESFPTDGGEVAWWGKFNKPFEYWGSPDLRATWHAPDGTPVTTTKVDTERCKLAKAVLKRQYFQPGDWRVEIDCPDGVTIDSQTFHVGPWDFRKKTD